MPSAYLNGNWVALEDAKVSVLDRGFLFGDSVYEVIPVYNGKLFCLDRHLARLEQSLAEVLMDNPMTREDWLELLKEAVARSGDPFATLYLQVTRGADTARSFVYPAEPTQTVFLMVNPDETLERTTAQPLDVVTLEDFRWDRGHIKTTSLIAAGILKNQAIAKGADDALLIKAGYLTESTSANVFVVIDGAVITPPKSTRLLHGITRDFVVAMAKSDGIEVTEREISLNELQQAEEVFLTASRGEVQPIGCIDGRTVGNGAPGVMWQRIDALFQKHKFDTLDF